MNEVIEKVAQEVHLPSWWVEAIAVEYLDCRDYATRDEIWTFNFDKISASTLKEAVNKYHVIVGDTIFHNVHRNVIQSRMIEKMFSNVPASLVKNPGDCVVEGLASRNCFPIRFNSLDIWDPKLSFSSDFQVLDEGRFWQWHIANLEVVAGRHYSKWVSNELNLEVFEEIQKRTAILRNPVIKPGQPGHSEFRLKVEAFYQWLGDVRLPILNTLKEIHCVKGSAQKYFSTTEDEPPLLSRFETFTINDGRIQTSLSATPIFYRACYNHAHHAEELINSTHSDTELVAKLDEIYQERATAIIMGSACLESFINSVGSEDDPNIWKLIEKKLSVEEKFKLLLELNNKGHVFKLDRPPFNFLRQLIKSRNSLVHFKGGFNNTVKEGDNTFTSAENDMPRQFVRDLPHHITQLVQDFSNEFGIPVPGWLTPQPSLGWLQPPANK